MNDKINKYRCLMGKWEISSFKISLLYQWQNSIQIFESQFMQKNIFKPKLTGKIDKHFTIHIIIGH